MNKTLAVVSYEIRATLARKAFLIVGLGLPLLAGLIVLAMIWINRDTASAPPVAAEAERDAQQVVGYLDPGGLIQVIPGDIPNARLLPYSDVTGAQAALEAGEIDGYYLIPADYLERGDLTYVQLEYQPLSFTSPDHRPIEWTLLVNLFGGDVAAVDALANPIEVEWQQATPPGATEPVSVDESWIAELLPNLMAFLLYMVIILPAGTLVATVTDEKKNRVMEILLSSVSTIQLIGGKIVALGLLGLLQTALWAGVVWSVVYLGGEGLSIPPGFQIPSGLLIWCFVFALLGYAMYGSMMAGLGALASDIKDSRGATMIVLSPLIVVVMFLIIIVARPDSPISIALSLFPLTSPVAMIARMTATGVPAWQPVMAAALQLLTAVLIVRTVARLFRAQVLLSGQPFSLKAYGSALLGTS
ncbi:MAG TPA: ABC transporter permease [Anaerolineae bacterium]|nr:ABC transporter permease [Anaerolineae bacterium]